MSFALALRDPILGWLSRTVPVAIGVGILAGAMAPEGPHGAGIAGAPFLVRLVLVSNVTVILAVWAMLLGQFQARAFPIQLTLPLSPRELVASRLLASYVFLLAPLAAGTLAFSLISGDFSSPTFQLWIQIVLILAVLPAIVQARVTDAEDSEMPNKVARRLPTALILMTAELLGAWLLPPLWLTASLLALVVIVCLVYAFSHLPQQFILGSSIATQSTKAGQLSPRWRWLEAIPVISPWAKLNRFLAPDGIIRLNMYIVIAGGMVMVWTASARGNMYSMFQLALVQSFLVLFAAFSFPRTAFLPIPRWRLFLQGAGQGIFATVLCLILVFAGGHVSVPEEGLFTANVASGVILWLFAWLLSVSAMLHILISYPASRFSRFAGRTLQSIHVLAAVLISLFATSGELPSAFPDWIPSIVELHRGLEAMLPGGALSWIIAVTVAAVSYFLALQMFKRLEIPNLKDRLVKSK